MRPCIGPRFRPSSPDVDLGMKTSLAQSTKAVTSHTVNSAVNRAVDLAMSLAMDRTVHWAVRGAVLSAEYSAANSAEWRLAYLTVDGAERMAVELVLYRR